MPNASDKSSTTQEDETTAEHTLTTRSGVKRRCISSRVKRIAERGAPVAAAKPAPAPPVITYLDHTAFFFLPKSESFPTQVPISTEGPSLPSPSPEKKLTILPMTVAKRVFKGRNDSTPRSIPSLLGIPPPFDSGTFLCTKYAAEERIPKAIKATTIILASLFAKE